MLYVITGQTATGKTNYAIKLALKTGGELINVDSRQIYKKLDIVTGKDLQLTDKKFHKEFKLDNFDIGFYKIGKSKIWLYDIVDPVCEFSAFDFNKCAEVVIDNIQSRGKKPIIVGGSYFYLKNLLYKTVETYVPPNQKLREKLNKRSVGQLQKMLSNMDLKIFLKMNKSDRQNPHRLIRKIEILSFSPTKEDQKIKKNKHHFEIKGLSYKSKDALTSAINNRVEQRIKAGAIEETRSLMNSGYEKNSPGLKTIGYKQIIDFLENKISKEQVISDWITAEVQYAKKQMTFMKKDQNINWIFI